MRFYTVPDARAARTLGVLRDRPHRLLLPDDVHPRLRRDGAGRARTRSRAVDTGGNMAAPLLAELLGGTPFLGFIAAVAFATILAVVAGLDALGRGGALARPLGERRPRRARRRRASSSRVARVATVVLGVVAIALGIAFKGQNVAFMVSLAFAIAASAQLPGARARRSSGGAARPPAPSRAWSSAPRRRWC